ncbi:MAG TPA: DUF4238 domain-containing protein [Terriglobia bacterium]|nr:DUF4238 domain-containing protein [Terriglobia bacterium]
MSVPKSQHTIPQCYLKQFVDLKTPPGQEPYVWIFERNSKKGRKRAPKNILTETDVYTFKGKDGGKDYVLEETLAQIEGDYTTMYERTIIRKVPLNQKEHVILCGFVAAMLQRTMKQKENIEDYFDRLKSMVENLEKAHEIPPKLSAQLEQQKENAHKMMIVQTLPQIARILGMMNLAFLCADGRSSFITSDAPCAVFNPELQWQRFYGPGLVQRHVEVSLPLSPGICVLFSWVNNLRGYLRIGQDKVHEQNRMVVGHSHEHFIANSPRLKRRWFPSLSARPGLHLADGNEQIKDEICGVAPQTPCLKRTNSEWPSTLSPRECRRKPK